jgi:D-alanine-D-alanine ligase
MQDANQSKRRLAVIFGGESVEHEVSVITAQQVMAALDPERYLITPVYITKSGKWLTGSELTQLSNFRDLEQLTARSEQVVFNFDLARPALVTTAKRPRGWLRGGVNSQTIPIDVAFPATHGGSGENGALQGLLEMAGVPYAGPGIAASALAMDKSLAKTAFRAAGLPVLDSVVVDSARLEAELEQVRSEIEGRFNYPVFVKPVNLGSSIAAGRADNPEQLAERLETAASYDHRLLIEPALEGVIEVNCAVLGTESQARPSACEQPVSEGMLSYRDKYASGDKAKGMQSSRRIIPAPISEELTESIQKAAVQAFQAVGAAGVARVDFFLDPRTGSYHVNEINTIPGSLAFYLWEPVGLSFPELLDELIEQGLERHKQRTRSAKSIPAWLLSGEMGVGSKAGAKTAPSPSATRGAN